MGRKRATHEGDAGETVDQAEFAQRINKIDCGRWRNRAARRVPGGDEAAALQHLSNGCASLRVTRRKDREQIGEGSTQGADRLADGFLLALVGARCRPAGPAADGSFEGRHVLRIRRQWRRVVLEVSANLDVSRTERAKAHRIRLRLRQDAGEGLEQGLA